MKTVGKVVSNVIVCIALLSLFNWLEGRIVRTVHAQTYGFQALGPIAPTVAGCPLAVVPSGYAAQCPVGVPTSYQMYLWNGTAWVAPATPTQINIVATPPLVATQTGNTVTLTCPTCVVPTNFKAAFDATGVTAIIPAQTVQVQ